MTDSPPGYDAADPETWRHHPNFPDQVLLLGSHHNFRRINRTLIEQHGAGDLVALGLLFRRWISAMRSHEAYEERKLYPFLERRFSSSFATSREGHSELHEAADEVYAAFESGDRARVGRALEVHEDVLDRHLLEEERGVVPMLLALERDEFLELINNPIERLLSRLEERDG